jgi:hypothetical protein
MVAEDTLYAMAGVAYIGGLLAISYVLVSIVYWALGIKEEYYEAWSNTAPLVILITAVAVIFSVISLNDYEVKDEHEQGSETVPEKTGPVGGA